MFMRPFLAARRHSANSAFTRFTR